MLVVLSCLIPLYCLVIPIAWLLSVRVAGYTQEEKIAIAMQHLVPKQLVDHALTAKQLQIPEDSVKYIGTRE